MPKDKIIQKGWYRLVITTGQKFTGQCINIKNNIQLTFDIGSDENSKYYRPRILIIHKDDIRSSIRLSPRYIETIETTRGGWTQYRHKGLLTYEEGMD